MSRARVLIVDDSVVVRRLLSDALSADPSIEIAGIAANGRIALAKIPQLNPDVVILDIEMPELDGLQTLPLLRAKYPKLPVIMFSTLTERGAEATIEALRLGATDWVNKPANVGSVQAAQNVMREVLIPKIRALTGHTPQTRERESSSVRPRAASISSKIDVVCIGVSTGGPNALADVIPALPANLGVPVLIVQHMPPVFTTMLARRLSTRNGLTVQEGQAGRVVTANQAWLAPGDFHLFVEKRDKDVVLSLNQAQPENSCRPAVDVLFRSVAKVYGARALGVILTGMGQDGLRGAEQIVEAGGSVIAQDEATSVVWGMPGAVAKRGIADKILPLQRIAEEIVRRARVGREQPSSLQVRNG